MKRAASTVFCVMLAGVLAAAGISMAQDVSQAQLTYYVDSLEPEDGRSAIFRVALDNVGMVANLEQMVLLDASLGEGEWDNVDVLAASPDGTVLYFVNDGPTVAVDNGKLGYYEIATDSIGVIGNVSYNDLGATVANTNNSDQGAITVDGTMYITNVNNDTLYRLDLTDATATAVGVFRNFSQAANQVDLQGADIAFDANGRLFVWANEPAPGAPAGLYAANSTTLPASGDIPMTYLGGNPTFYSGLGFLNFGFGNLLGSSQDDNFYETSATNGAILATYPARVGGNPFDTGNGDMTTAQLGAGTFCTFTIGYWKNHEWPASVNINSDTITEAEGRGDKDGYLWQARGNNFSMLYAQLIAAKLNCPFCIDVWGDAEAFLLQEGIGEWSFSTPGGLMFTSKQQKKEASELAEALDAFNKDFHCPDQ